MIAMLEAACSVQSLQSILIKSNSQVTIDNLTSLLAFCKDKGWIRSPNSNILRLLVTCLCERKGLTLLEKVKGHTGITRNEGVD
ncbi:hypothetical protein J132_01596 [Termitomyces sp. J132]|nr:hypothetical protein J132_01596 [Termitomyces sp. J132]